MSTPHGVPVDGLTEDGRGEQAYRNQARYIALLAQVRAERGEYCEACGVPARHVHHIIPVRKTGINADLVYEPANVTILCDDCHLLMHPLLRRTDWLTIRGLRGRSLQRG